MVRLQSRGVTDDVEVGGGHSTLTNTLTHKEEVIPATSVAFISHQQMSLKIAPKTSLSLSLSVCLINACMYNVHMTIR